MATDSNQVQERDARINRAVFGRIRKLRDEIREAKESIRCLEYEIADSNKEAREIEASVMAGRWWELRGIISDEDIASLADLEPEHRSVYLADVE